MGFHSIPLPRWVVEEIDQDPDLAYTDKHGRRNYEYVSLGCDTLPVLKGRTPVQVYSDYMRSFRDTFVDYLGDCIVVSYSSCFTLCFSHGVANELRVCMIWSCISKTLPLLGWFVQEVQVGMGPAGELRYPSYPESNGTWRFPGVGEFQCYDKVCFLMLVQLLYLHAWLSYHALVGGSSAHTRAVSILMLVRMQYLHAYTCYLSWKSLACSRTRMLGMCTCTFSECSAMGMHIHRKRGIIFLMKN